MNLCHNTVSQLGVARAPRSATQRKHESFQARQETRARPGKGGGHRTHLENVGRGYLDRLSPREGRGVAFLGEIALLAVPQSTLAQAAESCELLDQASRKKLKSRDCPNSYHRNLPGVDFRSLPDGTMLLFAA